MIEIQLWHKDSITIDDLLNPQPIELSEYQEVAKYDYSTDLDLLQNCERIFTASQNIEGSWRNPSCRSSTVGDIMIVLNEDSDEKIIIRVDSFGMSRQQ